MRARSHLFAITEALKAAALPFSAVDIDPLADRSIVRDLLALTRALLDPADRIAWLSILRAPWCGLTLADLEALVRDRTTASIWECLQDLRALTDDGQARAARLRDVLAEAFAEQGRWPLRRWVERVWMKLGGPACLERAKARCKMPRPISISSKPSNPARTCAISSASQNRVADLFAQPENPAGAGLQVMTIHKAKGLEFDTVIVPGLGRHSKPDDKPLVLFHEWREDDRLRMPDGADRRNARRTRRALPVSCGVSTGGKTTGSARVSSTWPRRAPRSGLHLMGHVAGKNGEPRPARIPCSPTCGPRSPLKNATASGATRGSGAAAAPAAARHAAPFAGFLAFAGAARAGRVAKHGGSLCGTA